MQIITLQRLVQALGGELAIVARFPKGSVALRQFGPAGKGAKGEGGVRELELM